MVARLTKEFEALERDESGGKVTGVLQLPAFTKKLKQSFPFKKPSRMKELLAALEEEHPSGVPLVGTKVHYQALFEEDRLLVSVMLQSILF